MTQLLKYTNRTFFFKTILIFTSPRFLFLFSINDLLKVPKSKQLTKGNRPVAKILVKTRYDFRICRKFNIILKCGRRVT